MPVASPPISTSRPPTPTPPSCFLRAKLIVDTPLGRPHIPARVEISPRALWLPAHPTVPVALPVHAGYEFAPPPIPVPALEESLSEKLAAWRRRRKLRDLSDLDVFGRGSLNEPLVRRLLVLKVWHDVVVDGLGARPFDPAEIVAQSMQGGWRRRTSGCSPSPSTQWHGSPASAPAMHSSRGSTTSNSGWPAAIPPIATRSLNSWPFFTRTDDSSTPAETTWKRPQEASASSRTQAPTRSTRRPPSGSSTPTGCLSNLPPWAPTTRATSFGRRCGPMTNLRET